MMRISSSVVALFALAASVTPLRAAPEPIEIAKLPYVEIFSPTFFWNDEADFIRVGSTTCPKGRAIMGGINIQQGHASLRVLESYPDGESWVMRVVNRQKPATVQSLQVRGFALCMLPAARRSSMLISQHPRLIHAATKFSVPAGTASATGRQTCPKGALVVSGGVGLDPAHSGPSSLRMEVSYPDPEGWNVRAANSESAPAATDVRAYAVCLGSGNEGISVRDFQNVVFVEREVPVKSGEATRQALPCGDNSYVLSGGSRTIRGRSALVEMQESFPDSPSSWTVAVANRGDKKADDATVRLFAVCIKK